VADDINHLADANNDTATGNHDIPACGKKGHRKTSRGPWSALTECENEAEFILVLRECVAWRLGRAGLWCNPAPFRKRKPQMSTELAQPSLVEPTVAQEKPNAGPVGFGGWLLIPMIGQTLRPLWILFESRTQFAALSNPALSPSLTSFLLLELAANACVLAFSIVVMVAMYRRRRSFPSLYRWQFYAGLAVFLADVLMASAVFKLPVSDLVDSKDISQIFGLAIWVWYVSVSVRVRNTFTA
jgi:hypothetical protein